MKLCLLLGGFIAACYELSACSGLRNRKVALISVNKAQKRSVRGACRIIQVNKSKEDSAGAVWQACEFQPQSCDCFQSMYAD